MCLLNLVVQMTWKMVADLLGCKQVKEHYMRSFVKCAFIRRTMTKMTTEIVEAPGDPRKWHLIIGNFQMCPFVFRGSRFCQFLHWRLTGGRKSMYM